MKIAFKTDFIQGEDNVMVLKGMKIKELRVNHNSKTITLVCEDPAPEKKVGKKLAKKNK